MKTKTTHTPGPWEVTELEGDIPDRHTYYLIECEAGREDLGTYTPGDLQSEDEAEANARLIAASPTLYDFVARLAKGGDPDAKKTLDLSHLTYGLSEMRLSAKEGR